MSTKTIEQKARAYDEALERARKQRDDYQKELNKTDKNSQLAGLLRAGISAIELAFPELAESEDEKMINELQGFLDSFGADYFGTGEWQKFHDWLEKQKEQKPAWSEEDEEHLKSIISTIEMCMRDCEDANAVLGYYDSDISWLKSLSPSWKPSEEQMNALYNVINPCDHVDKKALESLYKQLEKLI